MIKSTSVGPCIIASSFKHFCIVTEGVSVSMIHFCVLGLRMNKGHV